MLLLVVDTNLFHEFRRLEELPWEELGESEEIVLIVSDPVQTELDEQKKSLRARIKKRALNWTKRFRKLILTDQIDELVRKSNPSVTIRLDYTPPSEDNGNVLDLTIADDRIVAIAFALREADPDQRIALFSDDLRPLRKARHVGLEAMEIPQTWRRQPEPTAEEQKIETLTKKLTILSKQEPDLTLSCSIEPPIEFVLPIYEALSVKQVSGFMEAIKTKYPMEDNFERARNLTPIEMVAFHLQLREFRAASKDDIKRYIQEDYPNWLEQCHHRLTTAHDELNMDAQRIALSFELINQGTRPAKDLLITFETGGAIRILPNEYRKNNEEEYKVEQGFSLPKMPKAPQGEWKAIDLHSKILDAHHRMFDAHHRMPDFQIQPIRPTLQEISKKIRRDPNCFYYRGRPAQPTTSYSLTCKQFRHDEDVKYFDLIVLPEANSHSMDEKNAVVKVICGAANLSSSARINVPIHLVRKTRSTYDYIQEILAPELFTAGS